MNVGNNFLREEERAIAFVLIAMVRKKPKGGRNYNNNNENSDIPKITTVYENDLFVEYYKV